MIFVYASRRPLFSRRRLVAIHIRTMAQLLVLLVVLIVRLQLAHNASIGIRTDANSQWWVFHGRNLIHSSCTLRWVTSLSAVALAHGSLCIDMVVRFALLFGEIHGAAGPVCPESTWLDAGELDVPFGLELAGKGLREAFHCPLRGTVDCKCWNACTLLDVHHRLKSALSLTTLTTDGGDIQDASTRRLLLPHYFQRFPGHVDEPEVVHLVTISALNNFDLQPRVFVSQVWPIAHYYAPPSGF